MRKRLNRDTERMYVTLESLAGLLDCGRQTATKIGVAAGARVQVGKSVRYSVERVKAYLDSMAGPDA